jgi:hypothetical protein
LIREQIFRQGQASLAAQQSAEAGRYEPAGAFRIEKPAAIEEAVPEPAEAYGTLPARWLEHRETIQKVQTGRGRQLVALLTGIGADEVIDEAHYREGDGPARLAERRAELERAAGGAEAVAAFWRIVDAEGLRSVAEAARASDVPQVVSMVSGWEPRPVVTT